MLLRIQSDESLLSFVARNIYVNRYDPEVKELCRLANIALTSHGVKLIASAMGWPGCFGFNRLLHEHTYFPRYSLFKNIQDNSYSHREYISVGHRYEYNREPASYCPECVNEDLATLGFSYWRRVYRSDINVCAKHNVLLVSKCPVCDKPFAHKGHGLDVMWRGCAGRHIGESSSVKNDDPAELRKSKFFADAFNCESVLSVEAVLLALRGKFSSLTLCSVETKNSKLNDLRSRVEFSIKVIEKNSTVNNGHMLDSHSELVWECALLLYEDFEDFMEDVKRFKYEPRIASALWSTYRAGGSESAQYIEENYRYGVGHWSCPYPSPLSLLRESNDGFDRPMRYRCCNFTAPKRKGKQLSPKTVDFPPPRIPMLAKGEPVARSVKRGPCASLVHTEFESY
ncbi:TniQ family protein [Pseudomonas sp. UM16]|uniref:TniQ family protein n=1 Tax=Pseudomonas sp. UM16 TaxID=3158962 RepID=UPI00398FD9EB